MKTGCKIPFFNLVFYFAYSMLTQMFNVIFEMKRFIELLPNYDAKNVEVRANTKNKKFNKKMIMN